MSTRREFLKSAGPIVGMLAMAVGPGALALTGVLPLPHDDYEPVGHMDRDTEGAMDVDFVTVDGERVDRAFELDDVEGWVKYYGPNLVVEGDALRTFHRTGTVRVHWRREAPPTRTAV